MTLKETVLCELETADEQLLEDVMRVIRSRTIPKPTMTITDAISIYRQTVIAEGLDIDPDEIWGDVRDKTPADSEARW